MIDRMMVRFAIAPAKVTVGDIKKSLSFSKASRFAEGDSFFEGAGEGIPGRKIQSFMIPSVANRWSTR